MVNLDLKVDEELNKYLARKRDFDHPFQPNKKGIMIRYEFPNGYGGSVIKHFGSYGYEEDKWEIGLLQHRLGDTWEMIFTELVGGDVLGHLTDEQVNKVLHAIKDGKIHESIEDLND